MASRFLGFSVFISNTTNKKDGILCFKDSYYTKATIPNPINITCPRNVSGRVVIYYNNRTHPLTLLDIQLMHITNSVKWRYIVCICFCPNRLCNTGSNKYLTRERERDNSENKFIFFSIVPIFFYTHLNVIIF